MFAVIVLRDIVINILRGKAKKQGIVIKASWLGKAKTMTQMIGISFILFGGALPLVTTGIVSGIANFVWGVGTLSFIVSFVLTIISGIDYVVMYYKIKSQQHKPQKERS